MKLPALHFRTLHSAKFTAIFSLLILTVYAVGINAQSSAPEKDIQGNLDWDEQLYRHFHANPELSFREVKTAQRLAGELGDLGFEIHRNVGGNGFVGLLKNGDGPVVMLRTDMDALPLQEKTGLEFASGVPGVMHACGHDMHMTVWLGTARVLADDRSAWKGTLMMVAQQAEEKSGGANAMIADGLFKKFPVPDYALAFHVNAELPAGTIGYREGPLMAGVNSVDIRVKGVGGHGAMPQNTVDPIVLASRMVLAFQTIPSREISPLKPAVVTVGSIHGGTVHNIIPDEVDLQLTVRFYEDDVYHQIINSLKRITAGIAASAGLPESMFPEVKPLDQLTPPLINDASLVKQGVESMSAVLGSENLIRTEPVTAGEDFARYGLTPENIPIAMFWLGAVAEQKYREHMEDGTVLPGLHSPEFYPDFRNTCLTGVRAMSKLVLDLFNK